MKCYQVGGFVRDSLLGLPAKDVDWVVVGSTPDQMLEAGFVSVGKDFPVFLHPETKDEYALARTEKKTGNGYSGFEVFFQSVTLEEDLLRRDLTINAIAMGSNGVLHDFYGGRQDLENRVLRHVSPAFAEDPVRVLRVARFAARYASLGFTVAEETMSLMKDLVRRGEMSHLTPERVWGELEKALMTEKPSVFIEVLRECGALSVLFPEIDALFGVPQPEAHHPEIDAGVHTLMALDQSVRLGGRLEARYATLLHDLGKGVTPVEELPRHIGHESAGEPLVAALSERIRAPKLCREVAMLAAKWHLHVHRVPEMRPGSILKLLNNLDAFRREARFEQVLLACEADARGRLGRSDIDYSNALQLKIALKALKSIDIGSVVAKLRAKSDGVVSGERIQHVIKDHQIKVLKQI